MNICFITDNPETTRHPVIGMLFQHLSERHNVRLLDVHALTGEEAIANEETDRCFDTAGAAVKQQFLFEAACVKCANSVSHFFHGPIAGVQIFLNGLILSPSIVRPS